MNKWLVATIVLLLMFASIIFGFILGYPDQDLNAEIYVTGYNNAVSDLAFTQLNETVIFIPFNGTVEKVDLASICGWEE